MIIYVIYILIVIITIFLISLIKEKGKALRLTGILTITSSIILIIMVYIIKLLIDKSITNINISNITNYFLIKIIKNSGILFALGLIEIIISEIIKSSKRKRKKGLN